MIKNAGSGTYIYSHFITNGKTLAAFLYPKMNIKQSNR